ncbi:MAG: hypothetical protein LBL69_05580, partial [Zoogloeaceae bacterium]|nr:hypothetical protein [Zoogloeaceae bacterium]
MVSQKPPVPSSRVKINLSTQRRDGAKKTPRKLGQMADKTFFREMVFVGAAFCRPPRLHLRAAE